MKSLLTKFNDLSLLFKTSLLFVGVITCLAVTRFKPVKYFKMLILGRHRLTRILSSAKSGDINGGLVLDIYREIKQSSKLGITTKELKDAAKELTEAASFENRTMRKQLDDGQNKQQKSCFERIVDIKNIQSEDHKKTLRRGLVIISKALGLKDHLDYLRKVSIARENPEFCEKLKVIWNHFLPQKEYQRYTQDWQLIGFQGNDPHTDLRAAGIVFIDNFIYF